MENLINNHQNNNDGINNDYSLEKIENLIYPSELTILLPNFVLGISIVFCNNQWKVESYKKDCKVKSFLFPGDILQTVAINGKKYNLSNMSMNKILNVFYKNIDKKRYLTILRPFSNIESDLI